MRSVPILHKRSTNGRIVFPDIHTICLVVKCLIRDKYPNEALRVTEFLRDNCQSNQSAESRTLNTIDVPNTRDRDEKLVVLRSLEKAVDIISFDINTFFLNG
jgi:hypothetical protein